MHFLRQKSSILVCDERGKEDSESDWEEASVASGSEDRDRSLERVERRTERQVSMREKGRESPETRIHPKINME